MVNDKVWTHPAVWKYVLSNFYAIRKTVKGKGGEGVMLADLRKYEPSLVSASVQEVIDFMLDCDVFSSNITYDFQHASYSMKGSKTPDTGSDGGLIFLTKEQYIKRGKPSRLVANITLKDA